MKISRFVFQVLVLFFASFSAFASASSAAFSLRLPLFATSLLRSATTSFSAFSRSAISWRSFLLVFSSSAVRSVTPNSSSEFNFINSSSFFQEIFSLLLSCIGCLIIIPLTSFIYAIICRNKKIHNFIAKFSED
jgi:hypothetical protein